jgi:hypothetical protein
MEKLCHGFRNNFANSMRSSTNAESSSNISKTRGSPKQVCVSLSTIRKTSITILFSIKLFKEKREVVGGGGGDAKTCPLEPASPHLPGAKHD